MAEFIHKYLIYNGKLVGADGFQPERESQISVYEVLRLIGGVPLFYQDHLSRLHNSLILSDCCEHQPVEHGFPAMVKDLCQANGTYFGNLELRVLKCADKQIDYIIGFIPHRYPKPTEYTQGVKTAIMRADRKNPNAKVKDTLTRKRANEKLKELDVYELLLENSQGILTEGSRSNLFFIKNDQVYTAPEKYVLPGITRKYALKALEHAGIKTIELPVQRAELVKFPAAFICGTSPGVLAIRQINDQEFDVKNKLLLKLQAAFNQIVEDYLKSEQSVFPYNIG